MKNTHSPKASIKLGQIFALGVSLAVISLPQSAHAVDYFWDNDGATAGFGTADGTWAAPTIGNGSQGWSTSATGALVPADVTTGTGDLLNFGTATDGLATGTIIVDGTVSSGNMNFGSASGAITLSGGQINFGGNAAITNSSSSRQVIGSLVTIGNGDLKFNAGAGGLTLDGGISFGARNLFIHSTATAGTVTLNGAGTGDTLNLGSGGLFQLQPANDTTVRLALRNDSAGMVFELGHGEALSTGAVNVNAAMTVQSNTSLAGTSAVGNLFAIGNGNTLTIGGANNIEFSGAATNVGGTSPTTGTAITTVNNGATTKTLSITNTAATTISGKVALSSNATGAGTINVDVADTAGTTTISGAIVDYIGANNSGTGGVSGNLVKQGDGTLTLSGANTFTGNTTISAGTLNLSETGELTFVIGADGVNNALLGDGTLNLDGLFTFDLSGADTTEGNSWSIVAAALTESYGANFAVDGFTQDGDTWTLADAGNLWTFSEATGNLSVIPEASSFAMLAGLATLGAVAIRRRRRSL